MKKQIVILLVAGFMMACGGQGSRQAEEGAAQVQLEADLEEALQIRQLKLTAIDSRSVRCPLSLALANGLFANTN